MVVEFGYHIRISGIFSKYRLNSEKPVFLKEFSNDSETLHRYRSLSVLLRNELRISDIFSKYRLNPEKPIILRKFSMAMKLGTSIELWASFSEIHSESPVYFQNTA